MLGGIVRKIHQTKLLQEAHTPAGGVPAVHGTAQKGDAPVAQRVKMTDGKPGTVDQIALDADAFQ